MSASTNSSAGLPSTLFSTDDYPQREQFDAWRASIGVIFDVSPPPGPRRNAGVRASIRAYDLGGLIVSATAFDRQSYARDRRKIAADGLDHYLVQLYTTGGLAGSAHKNELTLRAGDVQILDLARPLATRNETSSTITIVVPRDGLDQVIGCNANLHGMVLRRESALGGLLGDYLRSIVNRIATFSADDAPTLSHSILEMISGCFNPSIGNLARARPQIARSTVERIKRYIDQNLESPELSVESICAAFRMSRSHLYEAFEFLGGVAHYLQERRLAEAYAELRDPACRHMSISQIALDLGFSSEAHFSRVFHREFGLNPRDARLEDIELAQKGNVRGKGLEAADGYEAWIRRLR